MCACVTPVRERERPYLIEYKAHVDEVLEFVARHANALLFQLNDYGADVVAVVVRVTEGQFVLWIQPVSLWSEKHYKESSYICT